jgi:hypothetical protein
VVRIDQFAVDSTHLWTDSPLWRPFVSPNISPNARPTRFHPRHPLNVSSARLTVGPEPVAFAYGLRRQSLVATLVNELVCELMDEYGGGVGRRERLEDRDAAWL